LGWVSRIDWDIAFKALGIIVGIIVSVYQLRNIIPRTRSTLKIDVEILKLLDPADPNYAILKSNIDENIRRTYRIKQATRFKTFHVYSWGDFIGGILVSFGFAVLTLYISRGGFRWWSVLTGFIALGGIGGILNGLEKPPTKPPAEQPIQPDSNPTRG